MRALLCFLLSFVNLSCIFYYLFSVTWYKSERELTYDFRHKITAFQNMHTMEVNEVLSSDAGEYVARASNAMGIMESKCIVRVTKKSARRAGYVYIQWSVIGNLELFPFLLEMNCKLLMFLLCYFLEMTWQQQMPRKQQVIVLFITLTPSGNSSINNP